MLAKSRNDPHYFNSVILGRNPYWSGAAKGYAGQREWCQDLVNHRVLALEQGNMTGKDYFVGGIIPWWLYTRRNSLVIVTGPGQSIIGSVTWKEVRLAMEGARFDMGAKISTGIKTSPHTVTLGTGWQALGFSTTSVERGSGQHNKNLLCIVEEASGVECTSETNACSGTYSKPTANPAGGSMKIYAAVAAGHSATPCDANRSNPSCGGVSPDYGGGLENFPRFLENWGGKTVLYRGSLVSLFESEQASRKRWAWRSYYSAPDRDWKFDMRFQDPNSLPPGTPTVGSVFQTSFRPVF